MTRVCADCGLGSPVLREGYCYRCYPQHAERKAAAEKAATVARRKPKPEPFDFDPA